MGVDFFPCNYCGESICDAGDYEQCNEDCYRRWCDDKCAEQDGYRYDEESGDCTCKYCRDEDLDDHVLLDYLLKRFGISRQDAVEEFNTHKVSSLTKQEKELLFRFADQACGGLPGNDFEISPATATSWKLLEKMEAWNRNISVKEWRKHPKYQKRLGNEKIYTTDVLVFGYLVSRLKEILKG